MKFRLFLTESIEGDLHDKLQAVLKLKLLDPSREARIWEAHDKLARGLQNKQIYNADFGEAKSALSYNLERAWNANQEPVKSVSNVHRWVADTMGQDFYYTHYSLNTSNKLMKLFKTFDRSKADKPDLKKMVDQMEVLIDAGIAVNNALKDLKDKVIKGRKPSDKPVDPNAFVQVLGSVESQKLVREALEKGITKPLNEFENQIMNWLQTIIDEIASSDSLTRKALREDPIMNDVMHRCFEFKADGDKFTDFKLNDRGKDYAAKEAKQFRDAIEIKFLGKNIRKLSKIVELKGSLDKIEQHPSKTPVVRQGAGSIECTFTFKFSDKSHFTVVNKIVTKWSNRGTQFNQLPTTFHDVTFPDGSKMKMPSEEKMVREFAVKK